jgi:hypothetical protein
MASRLVAEMAKDGLDMPDAHTWEAPKAPTEEEQRAQMERQSVIATELMDADPKLPFISAFIIAGDRLSAERSMEWVTEGKMSFKEALPWVGSYGRLPFMLWAHDNGHVDRATLVKMVPEYWSSSDTYRTTEFLPLFKEARQMNGGRYVHDGKGLPRAKTLRIYRGQDTDAPLGIAWTLLYGVAEKFALGAATRQRDRGGTVFAADVPRSAVLAYLTGRGEGEVIIDPSSLRPTS